MSRQHQHNCFNKTERRIVLKSFLPLTARKNCFYSSVWETKTFIGIVIFWVGGKNCIVKSEKCIVFPESWYVNSNPAIRANFANRKNHPSVGQWWITYISYHKTLISHHGCSYEVIYIYYHRSEDGVVWLRHSLVNLYMYFAFNKTRKNVYVLE